MDEPGTVFYLVPYNNNKYAKEIVRDDANRHRRHVDPNIASVPFLRIGLDQQLKTPPQLARFGRRECNDVILGIRFSRNDQCYFDFNKDTGELLLHDISENSSTELFDEEHERRQIWKTPRQCVVVLTPDPYCGPDGKRDREWIFKIRCAEFRLIPRRTQGDQGEATFTKERLAFAGQPDPGRTYEGTMQGLITLGLQSLQSDTLPTTYKPSSTVTYNPHDTRYQTPHQPEEDEVVRYTKLGRLGKGGQGEVHKVVNMYNGNHYACKIVAVKEKVPEWGINSPREFRAKVEIEVDLVRQAEHPHIVPYTSTQGWKFGQNIEIFMPIFEGSLHDLIPWFKSQRKEVAQAKIETMFHQILLALDHVHTHNPQIIHRDIKPPNILFQGDNFFLTDFGIAKAVDTSKTFVGTQSYMAPELWLNGNQTPKVDIYALGATFVECLEEFPPEAERLVKWPQQQLWHQHLQTIANQHGIAPMLADIADQRPTARELLQKFFPQPLHTSLRTPQNGLASPSFGISSPATNLANGTALIHSLVPTPMEWTRIGSTGPFRNISRPTPRKGSTVLQPTPVAAQRTPPRKIPTNRPKQSDITRSKSAKSRNEGQKKSQIPNASSQNERRTRAQSAGVPKQTSSRKRRSRSKSFLAKMQERDIGNDLRSLRHGID